MTSTSERNDSHDRAEWELYAEKHYRRNFWFGIASAVLRNMPMALLSGDLIMPYFIGTLHPLKSLVGVWSALGRVCIYVPQFLFAKWMQSVERRKQFYIYGCATQAAAFLVNVIFIVFWARSHPIVVLVQYYLMTIVSSSSFALLMLAFFDITGRMIPETKRGRFLGIGLVLGSLVGIFGVAPLVQFILKNETLFPYPYNFTVLHAASLVTVLLGMVLFLPVREPVVSIAKQDLIDIAEHFRRGFGYIKTDVRFRSFMITFAVVQIVWAASAYGIRFVTEDLQLKPTIIGDTLYTALVSTVLGNLLFGYVGDRNGFRCIIRWGAGFIAPGYALLLFIPTLVKYLNGLNQMWSVEALTKVLYHANIGLYGFGTAAFALGMQNYQISIPPTPHERPVYLSFPLLMILPISWVGIFWGWLVDVTGSFRLMFALVMIFVAVLVVTTIIMPNDRVSNSETAETQKKIMNRREAESAETI